MLKNWGWRITLVFSAFVFFIFFLVYRTMKERVDLVAEDYYAQELNYQERIDRLNNAKKLSENITVKQANQTLQVQFPKSFTSAELSGQVKVFVPSDASKDTVISIRADKDLQQYISVSHLASGNYWLKIIWQAKGVPYYYEQRMYK